MKNHELIKLLKAFELSYRGVDVTISGNINMYYNNKTKGVQKRLSENVDDFVIELADVSVSNFLGTPSCYKYLVRQQRTFKGLRELDEELQSKDKIVITLTDVKALMNILYDADIVLFTCDLEEWHEKTIQKLKEFVAIDRRCEPRALIDGLSKDVLKPFYNTLVSVGYHSSLEARKALVEAFNKDYDTFEIAGLDDYKIYDNRIYIKITDEDREIINRGSSGFLPDSYKYLVISKNPYDFFFCSYGSAFQSCFSLNSQYSGWYGAVKNCIVKGVYMLYVTTEEPQKVSLNGKFPAPRMHMRSWAYLADDNRLLVDKVYAWDKSQATAQYEEWFRRLGFVIDRINEHTLKYGQEFMEMHRKFNFHFYPDSLKFDTYSTTVRYQFDNGIKGFVGSEVFSSNNTSFEHTIKIFTELDKDSLDPTKDVYISSDERRIFNGHRCPVTNMMIPLSDDVSKWAKYVDKPVKKMAVVTYIDGRFEVSESSTEDYVHLGADIGEVKSSEAVQDWHKNLKCFKDCLTNAVKADNRYVQDLILLRLVEDDKVTIIKYKK